MCELQKMHHAIVALDSWHVPVPQNLFQLPDPDTYSLTTYGTRIQSPAEVREAVKDATIIAVTVTPLDAVTLSEECTPNLRVIVAVASGTDAIDKSKCRERGIRVLNSPNSNAQSVAEHAVSLYFASRRRILTVHHAMLNSNRWTEHGTLTDTLDLANGQKPLSCQEETVGIIGFGAVGQATARLCRNLGVKEVMIAARKDASDLGEDSTRTPFADVLSRATVLILCIPRNPDTVGLISTPELHAMAPQALLINVSRGGIVDEPALIEALTEHRISGAATDVFLREPSGSGDAWQPGDSPLLRLTQDEADALNLVMTPHVAWYTQATMHSYLQTLKTNVEQWLQGTESNIVV